MPRKKNLMDGLRVIQAQLITERAGQLNCYEFLFSAAPLRIARGTGSPLNPQAIF